MCVLLRWQPRWQSLCSYTLAIGRLLPAESMVFYENYLGTLERSITLNFSKPATNIIAQ